MGALLPPIWWLPEERWPFLALRDAPGQEDLPFGEEHECEYYFTDTGEAVPKDPPEASPLP